MHTLTRIALAGACLFGCASQPSTGSNTRTEDLSSSGHRAEAEQHQAVAQAAIHSQTPTTRDPVGGVAPSEDPVAHQQEARTHQQAAQTLEAAYRSACAAVPAAEHSQCSIASRRVVGVEDVPNGAALRFAAGGPAAAPTLARAQCTHAYADHAGREQLASCVLSVRDLTLTARDEAGIVVLTATTAHADSVAELRRRARAMQTTP